MEATDKVYLAIDLKSFYASVECVERGLDPLTTNLVVADASKTEKTICLAVTPSLKAYGIPGRARLFEVVQKVAAVNVQRKRQAPDQRLVGSATDALALRRNPSLALDYLIAPPHMAKYMQVSTRIYQIYLQYFSPDDIHVYSIDEVFIDATPYLQTYHLTAQALVMRVVQHVLRETGITATAGIGTNLYLSKIAMDIEAKHIPPDKDGVRIATLDEQSYRQKLWTHRPLTDFWRVGRGYAKKLEEHGMYTMGDVARCSIGGAHDRHQEALLYRLFGVNAELLIDHAWGWEPCTISDIKAYRPASSSLSTGQVLPRPYSFAQGRLIVREMTELLALDLVAKNLIADQMILTVGYDVASLRAPETELQYDGAVTTDGYGRRVPKPAHGSIALGRQTSSTKWIVAAVMKLYDKIVDEALLVRRMYVVANHIVTADCQTQETCVQLDLFTDYEARNRQLAAEETARLREHQMQQAMLQMKQRYGKNAILRGMNLLEGATTIARNGQVGGHQA